jgi:hypothetical protein
METSHHKIIDHDTKARKGKVLELGEWLRVHCSEPEFGSYNKDIVNACNQMHGDAKVIVGHFMALENGALQQPTAVNLYTRTLSVCQKHFKVCHTPEDPPIMFKSDKCQQCKAMAVDIHDVLARQREWESYRSRGHAAGVVEGLCMDMPMRFVWPEVSKLQSFCDDTLEDYEDELINAAVGSKTETELVQKICGEMTKSCKNKQLNELDSVWRSPFSAAYSVTKLSNDDTPDPAPRQEL